jgi:hypothetical protein
MMGAGRQGSGIIVTITCAEDLYSGTAAVRSALMMTA